jgi:hypothetical protein
MQGAQKEFRNASYFLGVSLLLLIPCCIDFINNVLYCFSVVAPYFCVAGISFALLKRGFINRLPDCIYILSMVLNVYLSRLTAVNSYYFMQGFDGLYDKMLNSLLLLLYSYGDMESLYYYGKYFLWQLSIFTSVIGFVIVFVALLYSTFGYIRQRGVFGAAIFMVSNCMWGVIGYMVAPGVTDGCEEAGTRLTTSQPAGFVT